MDQCSHFLAAGMPGSALEMPPVEKKENLQELEAGNALMHQDPWPRLREPNGRGKTSATGSRSGR
jgi:hypothetical protein